ncbi:MAG TPA: hypothetical protein V6D19_07070, partial [Stenomitos sp.]
MYAEQPIAKTRQQKLSGKSRKSYKPGKRRAFVGPLPLDTVGQRLVELFPNGWDWIYSQAPAKGTSPDWETIKKYPLSPVELWSLHQDPHCIIGIRPDKGTRWVILDIDTSSIYHPYKDPTAIAGIQAVLEGIGLVRTLICRSSHSGGLHIYVPLPEIIGSYSLAVALKLHLEASGYKVRGGQLELFPNVKRYIEPGKGFSLYNGVRLPFQPESGFQALDQDLSPLPWGLEQWLNAFDQCAAHQDLNQLKQAIADAAVNHRMRQGDRSPQSLESWQTRIEQEKQGWSGPGQTNEKLKLFACEARVFMGMDSPEQIATYIEQTARNTPGFYEHSNHQKDLAQRSRDVAAWAMKYYWPLGGPSQRQTGYHGPQQSTIDFSYHQAKREAAQHRIKDAIEQLQSHNQLPATATARAKAIVQIAKISQHTLYKASNLSLWHPDHFPSAVPEINPPPSNSTTEPEITQPPPIAQQLATNKPLNSLKNKGITQLLYKVGFVIITYWREALGALALKGQSATSKAITAPNYPERGESEGGEMTAQGWAKLRASLPERFQAKLSEVERAKQRQNELEERCRKALLQKQRQPRTTTPTNLVQLELEIAQQFQAQGKTDVQPPQVSDAEVRSAITDVEKECDQLIL